MLRRSEFNEPMDGIVYGVTVSLGFATYENYDYVFRLAELWENRSLPNGYVEILFSYTFTWIKWLYYGILFWNVFIHSK